VERSRKCEPDFSAAWCALVIPASAENLRQVANITITSTPMSKMPQTVPWTGLESSTRASAKTIDEVHKLPLNAFQRPEEPART
jgi:hypothetical protein